jgi:hypothetical protein
LDQFDEYFEYSAEDKGLVWKRDNKRLKKGTLVGAVCKGKGYRKTCFKGRMYYVHRIVWYLHYGSWPKHTIDHINRDKLDNRIENLRDVTHSVNNFNRKPKGY